MQAEEEERCKELSVFLLSQIEGGQVDMAGMAGAASEDVQHESSMSEVSSFGRSTEEVESFLLAMAAMKGGDEAARNAPPKARVYQENLRSW